ncbi:AI-2E family transporter [Roseofilum capinflatum]|uniref:AI-2E family transporter n=1 Tax=Roseofilum capinflatum BLCC-M114 TaxID=3022440 RepID=A0ABT7B0M6_9CYAN|nr:AI-2E family transporter [Roseofilum capinflatum]MDJ1172727.1 AI-2E family transporter [Roseofilum capinflatum BLCC-M114]
MLEFWQGIPRTVRLGLLFPLGFLNAWLLSHVINNLQPLVSLFITATLFSFLLNFPIQFLHRRGLKRSWAIAVVFLVAVLFVLFLAGLLIPQILRQLAQLLRSLPDIIESGDRQIEALEQWAIAQNLPFDLSDITLHLARNLSTQLQSIGSQALDLLVGTINNILNGTIILVFTLFLVFGGESFWQGIFSWIPDPWGTKLQDTSQQVFANYFVSQTILAGILSVAQTIVFVLLQVPYGLLFGVAIGMTTLVPYASALTVILASLIVGLQDFGLGLQVLAAALIVGQINDNIVAPRLLGDMIGLNPLWLMISLIIGGKFAGLLGLLLAVPVASVIKTMVDFARYPEQTAQESLEENPNTDPELTPSEEEEQAEDLMDQ